MPVVPSMNRLASELAEERRFLRSAHARVLKLRDRTALIAEHAGAGAAADELEPGELFARDVAVAQAAYRAATLNIAADRLCVGRIDGDLAGETNCTLYIGRMSVSDEHGDPM